MPWSSSYLIKAIFIEIVLEKEHSIKLKTGKLYFANTITAPDLCPRKGALFHSNSLQNIPHD